MAAPSARPRESFLRRDDQWKAHGACRDVDTERFYLESTRGRTRIELETRAKAICAHCPVVTECRDYALLTREPYGIWGGLTPGDRRGGARSRLTSRTSYVAGVGTSRDRGERGLPDTVGI